MFGALSLFTQRLKTIYPTPKHLGFLGLGLSRTWDTCVMALQSSIWFWDLGVVPGVYPICRLVFFLAGMVVAFALAIAGDRLPALFERHRNTAVLISCLSTAFMMSVATAGIGAVLPLGFACAGISLAVLRIT